ncbi:MAG: hypothetical protein MI920_30970 [Kiloniellales bacterium]|nr:hypothetical protein [Kiloniellales bacterium]
MTTNEKVEYKELESSKLLNRLVFRFTGILGLTTGIGVIAWGVWSLIATIATFVYEESGLSTEEILINNAFNEGLLLSAIVIALGVIVLEIKKVQDLMLNAADGQSNDQAD